MPKFHIRTLKLKLYVIDENKDASWKRLRQISNDAWKAANWIARGQLLNDELVRRIYARRKIDPKNDEEARNLVEEEFQQFFGTKRQATTERDIKEAFPNLPSYVTNPLNRVVVQSYNKEKGEMLSGNRSLRTYRRGMPIQTAKKAIAFYSSDNSNHNVKWKLGRNESIKFGIYYGRDKANHRFTIDRILKGELDYSAPQIQLKDKDLFLLLPVKDPQHDVELDSELSLGVDLGIRFPAYIALSKGPARRAIGDANSFLKVRTQMQTRRRQLHRSLKATKGGRGRQKKLHTLKSLEKKERSFVQQYNHFISNEIIDFAIRYKAGLIKMEMLEGYGKEEPNSFILRNWSYFELQNYIQYKAARAGIKVVKIDPYHTSQTCSICGHYEEGQRNAD